MGLKIRIKVKHLLFIIISVPILICFVLPNILFMYAGAVEGSDVEASKVCYKLYANLFSFGGRSAEALYKIAGSIVPEDGIDTRYAIYTTGYGTGGRVITKDMITNAEGYYAEILDKYRDGEYYVKAWGSLLRLYTMSGMFDEGRNLINEGRASKNGDVRFAASKYDMLYQIISGEYDKALETGNGYVDDGDADYDIYMLLGDACFFKGDYIGASGFYGSAQKSGKNKNGKYDMRYDNNASAYDRISLADRAGAEFKGNGTIHGRVIINGKPAPYVYIYLKDDKDGSFNGIGDEATYIAAVTDFNGEYTISKVPQGNFKVGAGVPSVYLEDTVFMPQEEGYIHLEDGESREYDFTFNPPMKMIKPSGAAEPVDGNVEVEWDKVEGAAYYLLHLVTFQDPSEMDGTYMASPVDEKISDTKFTLDIGKVNREIRSFSMDDNGLINPQAYLGSFYSGGLVPIYVEAFDKSGTRISSSAPIKTHAKDMAMISIKSQELTEGDKLILQKRPDEAAAEYEKELQKNPEDSHAMSVLFKLYTLGTRRKYRGGGGEEIEGLNQDRAEELSKRLYTLTNDPYYIRAMCMDYFKSGDYSKALEKFKLIPEDDLDAGDFTQMAQIDLNLKNYRDADRYYDKVYQLSRDTNYYSIEPVLLKIYLDDIEGGLKFLDILDLRLYAIEKSLLSDDIKKLQDIDKSSSQYSMFKEAIGLLLSHKGNSDYVKQFMDIYNMMDQPVLKDILRQAGNYYTVFNQY